MKKMNFFYSLFMLLLFGGYTQAQTYYYTGPEMLEEDDYELSFENIVSKSDYCKMAARINNLSVDFLLLKERKVVYKAGEIEQKGRKKSFIIAPRGKRSQTLTFKDEGSYNQKKFSLDFYGLYLIPSDGKVVQAPGFDLPATSNKITFGDFEVRLKGLKKETKETVAVFEATYKGREIGLVKPSNLVVVYTDREGVMSANDHKNAETKLLQRGDKCTFKAVFHISAKKGDMQFVPMQILWEDTFQITQAEELEGQTFEFTFERMR